MKFPFEILHTKISSTVRDAASVKSCDTPNLFTVANNPCSKGSLIFRIFLSYLELLCLDL